MSEKVVFYRLTKKIIDEGRDTPDDAQSVLYYTLGVGHHTGIIDCLEECAACSLTDYERIIEQMPEGESRRKLEGVLRFGEIQVDQRHVSDLLPVLNIILEERVHKASNGNGADVTTQSVSTTDVWLAELIDTLVAIQSEAAVYMIVRRRR